MENYIAYITPLISVYELAKDDIEKKFPETLVVGAHNKEDISVLLRGAFSVIILECPEGFTQLTNSAVSFLQEKIRGEQSPNRETPVLVRTIDYRPNIVNGYRSIPGVEVQFMQEWSEKFDQPEVMKFLEKYLVKN